MFSMINFRPKFDNHSTKIICRSVSRFVMLHSVKRVSNFNSAIRDVVKEFGVVENVNVMDVAENNRNFAKFDVLVEFKRMTSAIQFLEEKHRTVILGNRVEITYVNMPADDYDKDGKRNDDFKSNAPVDNRLPMKRRLFGDRRPR